MNKKISIIVVGIVGVGILLWIFLSTPHDNISHNPEFSIEKSYNEQENRKNIQIKFSTPSQENKGIIHSSKGKVDKKIKYATQDIERRYKILLIDNNRENSNITIRNGYKKIVGTIDNSRFILKIPIKSLQSGNLKLIVINIHNGEKKEIDARFLSEVTTLQPNQRYHLDLYFNDLANCETKIVDTTHIFPSE